MCYHYLGIGLHHILFLGGCYTVLMWVMVIFEAVWNKVNECGIDYQGIINHHGCLEQWWSSQVWNKCNEYRIWLSLIDVYIHIIEYTHKMSRTIALRKMMIQQWIWRVAKVPFVFGQIHVCIFSSLEPWIPIQDTLGEWIIQDKLASIRKILCRSCS